jgi:hypothetical protein
MGGTVIEGGVFAEGVINLPAMPWILTGTVINSVAPSLTAPLRLSGEELLVDLHGAVGDC